MLELFKKIKAFIMHDVLEFIFYAYLIIYGIYAIFAKWNVAFNPTETNVARIFFLVSVVWMYLYKLTYRNK